jgi:hypothetical protein
MQLLGMEICRKADGSIFLSQSQYITKILERFQMHNSNPVSTPMDSHVRLTKTSASESHAEIKSIYQRITHVRCDIDTSRHFLRSSNTVSIQFEPRTHAPHRRQTCIPLSSWIHQSRHHVPIALALRHRAIL